MPMIARKLPEPPRKANYQDVLDASPNLVAQIIFDESHLSARPADPHVWASGKLYFEIELRYGRDTKGDGPGDWAILDGSELRLDKVVLVPDIAEWRMEYLPRNRPVRFSYFVPD